MSGREFLRTLPDGRVFIDGHEASDPEIGTAIRAWAKAMAETWTTSAADPENR